MPPESNVIDTSAMAGWLDKLASRDRSIDQAGGGGDNGGMDDIPRRVEGLERSMAEVIATLGRLEPMIVRIDERTRDMPSAKEFGEVKGRVMQLPTSESFGELKGKLSQVPNWWQLFLFIFAAVGGSAYLARLIHS